MKPSKPGNSQPPRLILPDELYFRSSGYVILNTTTYRLASNGILTMTSERMETEGIREQIQRRQVSLRAWRKFERQIAPLRIESWKADYQLNGQILDGYNREFRWAWGGTRIESGGEGAEPGQVQKCGDFHPGVFVELHKLEVQTLIRLNPQRLAFAARKRTVGLWVANACQECKRPKKPKNGLKIFLCGISWFGDVAN
jgi:hypothetical protein